MKCITAAICNKAIVDDRRKLLSIIDVVDTLNLHQDPPVFDPKAKKDVAIAPVMLNVVTVWYRTNFDKPETGIVKLLLHLPIGKPIELLKTQEISLAAAISAKSIAIMEALPFRGLGTYEFEFRVKPKRGGKWQAAARLPLVVRMKPNSDGEVAAS